MNIFVFILKISFGLLLLAAGITHIIKPILFKQFTPPFLSLKITNYLVGCLEFVLGLGILIPNFSKISAVGIFVLMILFLPIHIWDLSKKRPTIGSKTIAIIRIPMQFLLMYFAYLIYIHS